MGDFGRVVTIGGLLSEIHKSQAIEGMVLHMMEKERGHTGPQFSRSASNCSSTDKTSPTYADHLCGSEIYLKQTSFVSILSAVGRSATSPMSAPLYRPRHITSSGSAPAPPDKTSPLSLPCRP